MAVPKKRTGASAQGHRRANWKATIPATTTCSNCNALCLTHTVCSECGYYKKAAVSIKNENYVASDAAKKPAKKAAPKKAAPKKAEPKVEAVEEAPKAKKAKKEEAAEVAEAVETVEAVATPEVVEVEEKTEAAETTEE